MIETPLTKLHVGSGTVYLRDYFNLDLIDSNVFLAQERPDLVESYITCDADYYARHKDQTIDKFRAGPRIRECVCDGYGDWRNLPFGTESMTEILSRQVFEHFDISCAREVLDSSHRVLRPGGILRLDVPDIRETLRLYGETKDTFYVRHFVGPVQKGDWGHHCMAYTREELTALATSHGFLPDGEESNIHEYPAFCLRFRKD